MNKVLIIFILLMFAFISQAERPIIQKPIVEQDSVMAIEPWMTNRHTWKQHQKMDRHMYRKHHSHKHGYNYVKKEG